MSEILNSTQSPVPPSPQKKLSLRQHLATTAILLLAAIAISTIFGPRSLPETFNAGEPLPFQLVIGLVLGASLSAFAFLFVLRLPALRELRQSMTGLAERFDTTGLRPAAHGLLAGVGEEILFRATIQALIGIWWTSIAFAALHVLHAGPSPLVRLLNTLAVFCISVAMGEVFIAWGLLAAISFHAAWDCTALYCMRQVLNRDSAAHA